jgi:acyl carrier protein
MNEFYKQLADILEVDQITADNELGSYPQWDSLSILSVIAMLDAQYGVNFRAAEFKDVRTAGELWKLVEARQRR